VEIFFIGKTGKYLSSFRIGKTTAPLCPQCQAFIT
jgi:hypothetical protein